MTIHIEEYDAVDPLQVLHLNLLCLDFALTPELVAIIRRLDPRPFPFFALYATESGIVVGQVGVFRLPMVSERGAEEVGGVWAVSTHPAFSGRGVATMLLTEAHARMSAVGLRYSTLATGRHRVAYTLYRKLGYEDVFSPTRVLARRASLPDPAGLRAERAGLARLPLAERLFEQSARPLLGFSRRHSPFFVFLHERHYLSADDLWLLWQGKQAAGYAAAFVSRGLLRVENLLLAEDVDPLNAVTALAQTTEAAYVQVRLDRPTYRTAFAQAGFRLVEPDWNTFMVKPLAADATLDQFRRSYGLNHNRFLISYMDVT